MTVEQLISLLNKLNVLPDTPVRFDNMYGNEYALTEEITGAIYNNDEVVLTNKIR